MSMFYQGDLNSGITLAIQESKCVVCVIKDDGEESNRWESEWLQDQNIPQTLSRHAIVFALQAGSQEAEMLSQFCSITNVPTLLVIYQGQLVDQLNPGISKNEFTLRLLRGLNPTTRPSAAPSTADRSSPVPATAATTSHPSSTLDTPAPQPSQPASNPTQNTATSRGPSDSLSATFSERRARLEREEAARREAARAQRRQEKSRALTEPESAAQAEARKRKAEAVAERDRVRRLVENDKAERKRREEERRAARDAERAAYEAQVEQVTQEALGSPSASPKDNPFARAAATTCALHVRLLDGSSIRNRFSASATVAAQVRPWIEEARTDGNLPYALKQILAPRPSKRIGEADEGNKSLGELGLAPSASLVMVPAAGSFSGAYDRAPGRTAGVTAVAVMVYGYVVGLVMWLVNAVRTFLGLNHTPAPSTRDERKDAKADGAVGDDKQSASSTGTANGSGGGAPGIRIRTLRDDQKPKPKDANQLYNGNQLNFEPNDDKDADS